MNTHQHYIALSGGVGGAKLAAGLAAVLPVGALSVVVNTGDDFEHLGLKVCPDLDSVTYALAGWNDTGRGWGRAAETWSFMESLRQLGGPGWFQLGDRDMAMHVLRTDALRRGLSLTQATRTLCRAAGVGCEVLPMSDDGVSTVVETDQGELAFQDYFVSQQCRPAVRQVRFAGVADARLNPAIEERLADPFLAGVIICPSNPYLSVDPILSVRGMRQTLRRSEVPVIAVSPFVRGTAVKGPAAKIAGELGQATTAESIARHYGDFLHALITDEPMRKSLPCDVIHVSADTWMPDAAARAALARSCVATITAIGRRL